MSARDYIMGLLAPLVRKDCVTIAEWAGHSSPDRLHYLLERATWEERELRGRLGALAVEHLGDEGVRIFDETGDLEKGRSSLGAARPKPVSATGDEVYGNSPQLRRGRCDARLPFVLACASSTKRRTDPLIEPARADEPAASIPTRAWQIHAVGKGAKGLREYSWGLLELAVAEGATGHHYLLVRQHLTTRESRRRPLPPATDHGVPWASGERRHILVDDSREEAMVIGDRWGVTDAEVARRYPCDDFVPDPVLEVWRGVTVRAAPERVWPWVAQVRLAPYSYDWIDNLGRRSPRHLVGLPDPVVGEPFSTAAGRRAGRIVSVDIGHQLTGLIMGGYMSYALVPSGEDTRLLIKIAASCARWVAPLMSLGDLVMARRQLLNLKGLAERDAARDRDDP